MKNKAGQVIQRHIETHSSLYLFTGVLFFMGVIFGTLTVNSLGYHQQNDLFYYFQQFMTDMQQGHLVDGGYAFYQNFMHSFKYIGFIWVLGLSIIGLPIILVMIFLKGVFIGFTVGFLVHQMGWGGFWFAFVSVIPQNLLLVPLILMMGVWSISFSFKLIGHLFDAKHVQQQLSLPGYVGSMAGTAAVLLFVSAYQTYVSPLFMNVLI